MFKDISYLQQPSCSAEQDHLGNSNRWHSEEHFCVIILNLDQWFSRWPLKYFLSRALTAILFSVADPFRQFW